MSHSEESSNFRHSCFHWWKCEYDSTHPNQPCYLCLKKPHKLGCKVKMRAAQDEKWAEWREDEDFYAEIRQIVEARLQRGESKADIRRLLQITPTPVNGPNLEASSSDSLPTPFPIFYRANPRAQASTAPFACDTIPTASHYSEPLPCLPRTIFTTSTHYLSNPSPLLDQKSITSSRLSSKEDLPPAEIDPNFSDPTTQMDLWSFGNFPQHPFDDPNLSQTLLPPSNANFDPSERSDLEDETQDWYQTS